MPLWTAEVLFIICICGAAYFMGQYGKHKKAWFLIFTAAVCLLTLALLAYAISTLSLLAGIR